LIFNLLCGTSAPLLSSLNLHAFEIDKKPSSCVFPKDTETRYRIGIEPWCLLLLWFGY